ncbi:hypothetical protein LJ656_27410 [Paraburkholderia sp. MMS20-SJTR3]|uniref:Excisionase-like domain-containing protein n=2 Tax=Paraburkholderia sejongensis TaxID=2886946 RepID=A0ABS8K2D8_9BURK|nr:hypothetical protein [Paraburkholderia sp. MMS20-SJTR3]
MRNGRLQRGVHFRRTDDGLELNIYEYRLWLDEQRERRRLPLVERVLAGIEDSKKRIEGAIDSARPLPREAETGPSVALPPKNPKLIPLEVWAREMFGELAPHRNTLLNWRRNARIWPLPIKVGGRYFVSPDAEYIDPSSERIRRMPSRLRWKVTSAIKYCFGTVPASSPDTFSDGINTLISLFGAQRFVYMSRQLSTTTRTTSESPRLRATSHSARCLPTSHPS